MMREQNEEIDLLIGAAGAGETLTWPSKSRFTAGRGASAPAKTMTATHSPSGLANAAKRRPPLLCRNGQDLLALLVMWGGTLANLKTQPSRPAAMWQVGACSMKGFVRSENQDIGLAFAFGEYDVLMVLDGCGGLPHGRDAAYLAAVAAATRICRRLGTPPVWRPPEIPEVLQDAIWAAHHQLAMEADALNVCSINGGLRTTLLVAIGYRNTLHYAYVGDGAGVVLRTSGEVERFLVPQRASGGPSFALAASLGPTLEGEPVIGCLARGNGDLVMLMSDGIADRIPKGFAKDVMRGCIQHAGDLQNVAELVCQQLSECQDARGYICDDNVTLALMGTRTHPVLAPDFWGSSPQTSASGRCIEAPAASAGPTEGAG